MKVLIIGGNRFVGLRLCHLLDVAPGIDLHVINRTGQVAHTKKATIYKGDRMNLALSGLDKDWDVIVDFACYDRKQAESALSYFGQVGRYILISTVSVYNVGPGLTEQDFDPKTWNLATPTPPMSDQGQTYQYGKRQAEAVFAQQAPFKTLTVRFPFILGPDDYTHRLSFHVDRILDRKPIFAEDPKARFSVIHSQDAAQFLLWAIRQPVDGPVNVASATSLTIQDIVSQIHLLHDQSVTWAKNPLEENTSPYSAPDWFVKVDRMHELGFQARPVEEWLADLLGQPEDGATERKGYVH